MFDDEPSPTPPANERVARRAIVFAALAMRSELEGEGASTENVQCQKDMVTWLAETGANAEVEPLEQQFLEADIGTLTPKQTVDRSWEAEAMVVLAWALGLADLPPFDRVCQPATVAQALGFWQPNWEALLATVVRRSEDEVAALANHLFTVHWRLREFYLHRQPIDFVEVAERTQFGLDPTDLPLIQGDLAVDGRKSHGRSGESVARVLEHRK
ncbi:MAG TPA: DUF4272 domain-containing protein [Steroidobacteraceae bacterium]